MKLLDEPKTTKEQITELKDRWASEGSGINWDNLAIWSGNRIQKYLWDNWKGDLKKKGFTWQKFLKLMKYRTDDILLWINNKISWKEFVKKVTDSIDGHLGNMLIGK